MSPTNNVTRDSWKQILASAVTIFDDLEKKGFGSPDAVIGGGTVLMFRFEHRLSKDIDFFMHDVQWLSLLAPRLNDTTAAMVTSYVEQPNGIKLVLPHGDIDFVVARPVTEAKAVAALEFMGRTFLLEPTEEILAKKLFYRAARFQPRDVFDLDHLFRQYPDAIGQAGLDPARVRRAAKVAEDIEYDRYQDLVEPYLDEEIMDLYSGEQAWLDMRVRVVTSLRERDKLASQ